MTFVVLFSFAAKRAALITMLPLSLRRVMGKMWHACTMVQQGLLPGALQSSRLGLRSCSLIPTHGILDTGVSRSYESCQTFGNCYYTRRRVEPVEGGAAAGARSENCRDWPLLYRTP